jgi:hypothetical protein
MSARMVVLGGMLVSGGVAAAHVPAFQARSEVDPGIAHGNAFCAGVGFGWNVFAVCKMFADRHGLLAVNWLPDQMLTNPLLSIPVLAR